MALHVSNLSEDSMYTPTNCIANFAKGVKFYYCPFTSLKLCFHGGTNPKGNKSLLEEKIMFFTLPSLLGFEHSQMRRLALQCASALTITLPRRSP